MNDLTLWPLTLTIVIATSAVTIVSFQNRRLFELLMMDVEEVLGNRGEWWRLLTSGFVHADYPHLFMNMVSLYFFGSWFEHVISSWRFGITYGLGILIGSFVSLIVHRHNPRYLAVGASAGVCAVVGAATVVYPDLGMMIFPLPFALPAWIIGSLFVAYSIIGSKWGGDNIGHEAHLGGTFAGVGLVAAFFPELALQHWPYVLVMLSAGAGGYIVSRRMSLRR
ncbi:MAG: rhomboid family intramembrane serine protease [Candidatus Kapabacteria bacterium]|nr:rhomboid family intramembrane serine protease [Candidatus Kapabacteria bacterium]